MANKDSEKSLIDADVLAQRSGLSTATIWRLKREGKITFFQPAGKNGRVKFPEDAIERSQSMVVPCAVKEGTKPSSDERLPGPRPSWMSPTTK